MEDIHGPHKSNVNGIQGKFLSPFCNSRMGQTVIANRIYLKTAWAEKGIVGRGVLLDFHRWRLAHNVPAEIFKTTSIPLKYLKSVAEWQGTEIKFGDILIVRVGMRNSSLSAIFVSVELYISYANGRCRIHGGV